MRHMYSVVPTTLLGKKLNDKEKIPATTKQSGLPDILMEHGVGLKNVKDVAERYLGYMDIRAEKDTFRVTVMLQQKEEV